MMRFADQRYVPMVEGEGGSPFRPQLGTPRSMNVLTARATVMALLSAGAPVVFAASRTARRARASVLSLPTTLRRLPPMVTAPIQRSRLASW